MDRKLLGSFGIAALAFMAPLIPTAAVAADGSRHCVTNVDSGRTTCGSQDRFARTASSVTASAAAEYVIARFYDGTGYSGATYTWVQSRPCTATYDAEWQWQDLRTVGWDNKVSSVRTYNSCDVKLYADVNFGGASSTWIDAASNLGTIGTGWSNRASSVKFS